MSADKKHHKKHITIEDEQEGESGISGQGGHIAFRDFTGSDQFLRDDLSSDVKKQLLNSHQYSNEIRIKKQKDLRAHRELVKSGKIPLQTYREGLQGTGMNTSYQQHPILGDKAQFSGIDRQENPLATVQVSETNEANRDDLELQYRLRYAPEHAPRFNPKPQYNR